jgi:hypothetical protein
LGLPALGAGLGLSSISPWSNSGVSASTFKTGAGIYLVIVVDAKQMMVDNAFDEVEDPKPISILPISWIDDHSSRPCVLFAREGKDRLPQVRRCAVKGSIPTGIELEVFKGVHGILAAQHVVPQEDLVENDTAQESTEP